MKTIIKELLDEMIVFKKTMKLSNYLTLADEHLKNWELSSCVGGLLLWNKFIAKNMILDRQRHTLEYMLVTHEIDYKQFSTLFTYCPELNEIFILASDRIKFQPTLTEEERAEIRVYIETNYKTTLRMAIRYK